MTLGEARELGEHPGAELEVQERFHTTHTAGNSYTTKSSRVTAKLRRDGHLVLVAEYDHGRLTGAELIEPDRVRVFDSVMLDYGGDRLLAEIERIPITPDGERGQPVPRDVLEQFDPIPLYRRYYARRDTEEWRTKVIASYIEDFAPNADPTNVAHLLEP